MENELAFYISQGVGGGNSVMDKRYEFYRNGRPVGLSSDDYRRLFFLDLLGADANDPRSTSDLEAAWFAAQGFGRAQGFAAAYVGQALLGGEPLMPMVTAVYANPDTTLQNIWYSLSPDQELVPYVNDTDNELVVGDTTVFFIRSQTGTADWATTPDPFRIEPWANEIAIENYGGGVRQTGLYFDPNFKVPKAGPSVPADGVFDAEIYRNLGGGRTLYNSMNLRNINPDKIQILQTNNSNIWEGEIEVEENTLLLLQLGWEASATVTQEHGPTAGIMAGSVKQAFGTSDDDPAVSRTQMVVYSKVVPAGVISMANSDITTVSGTGSTTSIQGNLIAIAPRINSEPNVGSWLNGAKLMAHRGGSGPYPEHSRYAYINSVGAGFKALEISCNRTTDAVWVANHDRYLDRTALGTETTTLDITAMLWADVQTHEIAFANGRVPQPITTVDALIAEFDEQAVFMVDPKNSTAFLTEFLDLMDTLGGPEKIMIKFFGPGTGVNTIRPAAQARGYKTWGYYYEGDDFTDAGLWDILGLNQGASQATWDTVKAFGPPVLAHIINDQIGYDDAFAKGADGFQIAGVTTIYPE